MLFRDDRNRQAQMSFTWNLSLKIVLFSSSCLTVRLSPTAPSAPQGNALRIKAKHWAAPCGVPVQLPPHRQHPCAPRGEKPILALHCPSCPLGKREPAGGVAVISHRTPPVARPQRLDGEGEADAPSRPPQSGKRSGGCGAPRQARPRPAEQLSVRLSSIQGCARWGKARCPRRGGTGRGCPRGLPPAGGARALRHRGIPGLCSRSRQLGGPAHGGLTEHRNFTLFTHVNKQEHQHSLVTNHVTFVLITT